MTRDALPGRSGLLAAAATAWTLSGAGPPALAGDVAFGEHLSGECVTCHQRLGGASGIPSITGWPQNQFVAVLNAYRLRERDHAAMQAIAGRLADEEVAALAAYFATLPATRAP